MRLPHSFIRQMSIGSDHFLPLLKRLDRYISYIANNLQYVESGIYLSNVDGGYLTLTFTTTPPTYYSDVGY
ncbi:hypothetical protein SUGI_1059720 [Cryptomeria japonica]|nr:hypothetical protein SUGI_1059720 [Cryptomeria japonica]